MRANSVITHSEASSTPLVSVVIPTHNRPDLVARSARTALAQTISSLEVIVIIDGYNVATRHALESIGDPRLRIIEFPTARGANEARNAGIDAARGEWTAMLDDDDEWLPTKLERQLAIARASNFQFPIVSCRFYASSPYGETVRPRRLPAPKEPIGDYLFGRRSFLDGEACIATVTLVAQTAIWRRCKFSPSVRRHQETDWVLRATELPGVGLEFSPEPLAISYMEQPTHTISNRNDWTHSLEWIRGHRDRLSKRAYAGFVLGSLGSMSAQQRDWKAFYPLLKEGVRFGRPTSVHLALYLAHWTVPPRLRRRLRWSIQRNPRMAS